MSFKDLRVYLDPNDENSLFTVRLPGLFLAHDRS